MEREGGKRREGWGKEVKKIRIEGSKGGRERRVRKKRGIRKKGVRRNGSSEGSWLGK